MSKIKNTIKSEDNQIRKCPHCKSEEGYYVIMKIKGRTSYNFKFDGSEAYNGHIHDCLTYWIRNV